MRCHLILDKGFLKFIKEKKDITKIAVVLALGLVLVFIGSSSRDKPVESRTGVEDRLAELCSGVDGVGECSVLVYFTSSDESEVESVIVICEGADNVDVRLRLTEMLSSFFGIGSNRIRIEKMKG